MRELCSWTRKAEMVSTLPAQPHMVDCVTYSIVGCLFLDSL